MIAVPISLFFATAIYAKSTLRLKQNTNLQSHELQIDFCCKCKNLIQGRNSHKNKLDNQCNKCQDATQPNQDTVNLEKQNDQDIGYQLLSFGQVNSSLNLTPINENQTTRSIYIYLAPSSQKRLQEFLIKLKDTQIIYSTSIENYQETQLINIKFKHSIRTNKIINYLDIVGLDAFVNKKEELAPEGLSENKSNGLSKKRAK